MVLEERPRDTVDSASSSSPRAIEIFIPCPFSQDLLVLLINQSQLDTDADNLFVAMTARGMNPDLFIVARSSSITSESKILRAGADRVITPNVIGGRRMASSVLDPFVSDYLELVSHSEGVEYRLDTFQVGEQSALAGQSIREARVRDVTGAYIMAVARGGVTDSNPSADRMLAPGDHLVAFGTRAQLDALGALL